jgi:uncharacterized protein YpiB (UPF0302 family)
MAGLSEVQSHELLNELLNRFSAQDLLRELAWKLQMAEKSEYSNLVGKLLGVLTEGNWPPSC